MSGSARDGSPIRLLCLAPDSGLGPGQPPGGLECHNCVDLSDLVGRAVAGAADAVVVSPRVAGLDAAVVQRLRALGCRVLALACDPDDVARAGRIGLHEVVGWPMDASVVVATLRTPAPSVEKGASPGRRGRVVAVWGPPGAPGRSAISALLAAGAGRAGLDVAVVDADLAAPHWSLMGPAAGPAPASGLILASRRTASGLPDVEDLMSEPAPGVRLLTASAEPDRWVEVSPDLIDDVLHAVARLADVVVVDLGCDIRDAHPAYDVGWAHDAGAVGRAVIRSADHVMAVMSAEPLGVHRFASWWPVLRAQVEQPAVVANKVGMPRAGRRPKQQVADVLQAIGADPAQVFVPWDPRAADALLQPGWFAARGWGTVPDQLRLAAGLAAGAAAEGRAARPGPRRPRVAPLRSRLRPPRAAESSAV